MFQEQPQQVIDKYLKGVPYKNDYPGPFTVHGEMPRDGPPMEKPLVAPETPESCTQYGNAGEWLNHNIQKDSYGGAQVPFVTPPKEFPNGNVPPSLEPSRIEGFKDTSMTDPQNETGFGQIVPTFKENHNGDESSPRKWCPPWSQSGNPLLDIKNRPVDQFSHNNMVPFYGANVTQNMHSTGVPQAGDNNDCEGNTSGFGGVTPNRGTLEAFTGRDEAYMHKREVGPMFSPAEQQTGWVYGTPGFRPDLDQYKQTMRVRNNEAPVQKLRVGPGIATDYNVPALGGFQQYTRILPNNVNDYKANQLEGRITGGKWQFSNKPTSQFTEGVSTNRPKEYVTQARRPTMQGKFYTNAQDAGTLRVTDQVLTTLRGKQGRSETEVAGGYGQLEKTKGPNYCVTYGDAPVGKVMGSAVPKIKQDRGTYAKLRENFKKTAAGTTSKGGYWECRDMTQGQERWDLLGGGNLPVSQTVVRDGWYVNETDRGDTNPYIINATGTQFGGKWNPLSYTDQQKVTKKETMTYSYHGNATGGTNKITAPVEDQLKTTRKQTTTFAHQGDAGGGHKKTVVPMEDSVRTTRKELISFAHQGNANGGFTGNMSRWAVTGGN